MRSPTCARSLHLRGFGCASTVVEAPAEIDDVRHPEHVDEHVDLAAVVRVEEVQPAISLHQVEALVRLVAEAREELERDLAISLLHRVVEVAVLALQRRLVRAGRVDVDARPAEKFEAQLLALHRLSDATRLVDRILQRALAHKGWISITIVLRSVICSSANRPPTRPI